ncbi:transposase [Thioploca ingrica]|uniref:Transposase n=1 Tax=Thioploca ingrica TaxID=40754 RepID=A0A090AGM8_9GAMM|nr:transposase [Thioploca ingrica]
MTYSREFRRKVFLRKEQEQLTFEEIAKRFAVGKASVVRWSKRIEAQRTLNKPATPIDRERLKKDIEKYPDASQYEQAECFGVSPRGIGAALKRLGRSCKKNALTSENRRNGTTCVSRPNENVSTC